MSNPTNGSLIQWNYQKSKYFWRETPPKNPAKKRPTSFSKVIKISGAFLGSTICHTVRVKEKSNVTIKRMAESCSERQISSFLKRVCMCKWSNRLGAKMKSWKHATFFIEVTFNACNGFHARHIIQVNGREKSLVFEPIQNRKMLKIAEFEGEEISVLGDKKMGKLIFWTRNSVLSQCV